MQIPLPDTTVTSPEIPNMLSPQNIEKGQKVEELQNQLKNLANVRDDEIILNQSKDDVLSENRPIAPVLPVVNLKHHDDQQIASLRDIQSVPYNPHIQNVITTVEPPFQHNQNNMLEDVSVVLPNAHINEQNSWVNNSGIKHVIPHLGEREKQNQASQLNLRSVAGIIKDNAKEQLSPLGNI